MNELLQNLLRLQALEFDEVEDKNGESAIAALRATIPQQILAHYDRLVAKGKKGVTAVRNQVCTGCHMRVPIGAIMTLKHGDDIQLCESCGRYLYLPPEVEGEPVEQTINPKPAKKSRKSKKSVPAA